MPITKSQTGVLWVRAERDSRLVTLISELSKVDPTLAYNLPEEVRTTASDEDITEYLNTLYSGSHIPVIDPAAVAKFSKMGSRVRAKEPFVDYTAAGKLVIESFDAVHTLADVMDPSNETVYPAIPLSELVKKPGFWLEPPFQPFTLDVCALKKNAQGAAYLVPPSGVYRNGVIRVGDVVRAKDDKVRSEQIPAGASGLVYSRWNSDRCRVLWEVAPNVIFQRELSIVPYASLILEVPNTVPYKALKEKHFPLQ